jgi:hypothetical protein
MDVLMKAGYMGLLPALIICSCLIGGCTSLVEKGGQVLDGSAFAEKTLEIYRAGEKTGTEVRRIRKKDGAEFIAIFADTMPNLRLNGSAPEAEGGFYLSSLYFLCSALSGWNEFTMELSGGGSFKTDGTRATLKLDTPIETLNITEGKIRRGDTRIGGGEAVNVLRNRQERILALTEWMHSLPGAPNFTDQKTFEDYWKPILLPELTSPKKRPSSWTRENALWVRAEDIRWNTTYTRELFPPELGTVRDSGTLLRDWEEASGWIYCIYEWDRIVRSLSGGINLIKVK